MLINYKNLESMDVVFTGEKSIYAAFNRKATAGRKAMFDKSVPTHCGLLIDFKGQKLMLELTGWKRRGYKSGVNICSLHEYSGKRFIIDILRSKVFADPLVLDAASKRVALDIRYTLEYDYKGVIGSVLRSVKEDPKKFYCSEYVYAVLKESGVSFPIKFSKHVWPCELYTWLLGNSRRVAWRTFHNLVAI